MDFVVPADQGVKLKEGEKRDEYLELARELKKLWNMKVTLMPIVIRALRTIPKESVKELMDLEMIGQVETIQNTVKIGRIDTGTGGLGNKKANGDYPSYNIVELGQNTENSSGDSSDKPSANFEVR